MMSNTKKMAVAAIVISLVSLIIGVIAKLILKSSLAGFSPSGFGQFTIICLLTAINLLLLDKKI